MEVSAWKEIAFKKPLLLLKLLYIVHSSRGTYYHKLSRNAPPPQELQVNWMLTGMVLLSTIQKQVINPTYSQIKSSCEKLLIQGTWSIPNADGGKCDMLLKCIRYGTPCLFCTTRAPLHQLVRMHQDYRLSSRPVHR